MGELLLVAISAVVALALLAVVVYMLMTAFLVAKALFVGPPHDPLQDELDEFLADTLGLGDGAAAPDVPAHRGIGFRLRRRHAHRAAHDELGRERAAWPCP